MRQGFDWPCPQESKATEGHYLDDIPEGGGTALKPATLFTHYCTLKLNTQVPSAGMRQNCCMG